jgi:hypothetical protein
MMIVINPILLEIGNNFKQAHTSEPDSVEAIALMVALLYRTNREPYIMEVIDMIEDFEMPEKLARKFHSFLKTQGYLLGQLKNDMGFFGGEYSEVIRLINNYWGKKEPTIDSDRDWDWGSYAWPFFTFVKVKVPETINYSILKLSQL